MNSNRRCRNATPILPKRVGALSPVSLDCHLEFLRCAGTRHPTVRPAPSARPLTETHDHAASHPRFGARNRRRLGRRPRIRPGTTGSSRSWLTGQRFGRSKYSAWTSPVLPRGRHARGAAQGKLPACAEGPFKRTDFSIGHRGAALQFPEHTRESYEAAARMGAGIVECDVTFTKDLAVGLPPCPERPPHHHQYPHDVPRGQVHAAVPPAVLRRRWQPDHPGHSRVPHQRHHAGRIQDARGQDGRVQPARADRRGVHRRDRRTSGPTSTPARRAASC